MPTKLAPAPWTTDPKTEHQSVLDANGVMVADCAIFGIELGDTRSDDVCAAHARAIAALPDLMAFIEQLARMTTPEDEFEDDPRDYGSPEEMVADFDDARLCGEYEAFMHKVREARAVLTKARGQVL